MSLKPCEPGAPECPPSRLESLLFALMIVVLLVPIWAFKYLPTTDGPAHVYNADILREYYTSNAPAYREYYTISKRPKPNLIGHIAMAVFMLVTSPTVAEKLLLSAYVIGLPLSLRYALGAVRTSARSMAFLAFPCVYNYLLHMGFYNFSLSVAAFFFTLGYWLKHRENFTMRRAVVFGTLNVVLYACHIFSLMMVWGAIGLMALAWTLADVAAQRRQGVINFVDIWAKLKTRIILPGLSAIPALLAAGWFLHRDQGMKGWSAVAIPVAEKIKSLMKLDCLVSFNDWEYIFTTAMAIVLAVAIVIAVVRKWRGREWFAADAWALVCLAYLAMYLGAKEKLYITHRLHHYVLMAVVFWIALQLHHRYVKRALQIAAACIAMCMIAGHIALYAQYNRQFDEYLSVGSDVAPNSTLLPLMYANRGIGSHDGKLSQYVEGLYMAAGYLAAEKNLVDLRNYEGDVGFFPVHFRPELSAFKHMATVRSGLEIVPPCVDLERYQQETDGRGHVDYVLVWGMSDEDKKKPETLLIRTQLEQGFVLIRTSARGYAELYRRKDFMPR